MRQKVLWRRRHWLTLAAAAALTRTSAAMDRYPARPIRIVIPFSSGGVLDAVARNLAHRMTDAFGETVLVDNRPGGGGHIGMELVAHSKPDGYTFVISGASLVTSVLLQPRLPYQPLRDLAPVAMLASTPGCIMAYPGAPFTTIKEMIAYAKSNPGKLSFATAGAGSLGHMLGEWLNHDAGIDLVHVPYKGGSAAEIDVIAGRVPLWIDVAANREMVLAGKVRALAVTSVRRAQASPGVPTLIESGYDIDGFTWWALMAPSDTPKPIVDKVTAEIGKIIASPEGRHDLLQFAVEPDYRSPAELSAFLRSELDKWGKVVRETKMPLID